MSYILDALKKSDQDRQRGKGPTLQTIHRPVVNAQKSKTPLIFIISIVLIALLATGVWWYKHQPVKVLQALPAPNLNQKALVAEQQPVTKLEAVEPLADQDREKPLGSSLTVLRFQDLPANLRAAIPGLSFSFHVYSDNPARRTIIINGRRFSEGQWVEPELFLQEISAQGVVMVWQQRHAFSVDVVDAW